MKPKIIALYLPQFHQIPENDEFWGERFTDWVTVKNAKPLFEGHQQPRVPLNDNYYDLSIKENVEWQSKLAHDYGIYGFGVYHYWFNNEKNLLTKPAEIMRDDDKIETKYFFIWDNCSWKRSWSNVHGNDWAPIADTNIEKEKGPAILIPYILGDEADWEKHYRYLSSHFHSDNYEKYEGKPVYSIFFYNERIAKMCRLWDELAKNDGFNGMCFIFKYNVFLANKGYQAECLKYMYEPHHAGWEIIPIYDKIKNKILRVIGIRGRKGITYFNYDKIWKHLIKLEEKNNDSLIIPGAFVGYDDSPRRGALKSKIIIGGNPSKFKKYFEQLYRIARKKEKPYIFLTAWNEWGEGAYLEPDTNNKYVYLESIKEIISK